MSDAADICRELRSRLENEFSMPFEVSSAGTDGEEHFICVPANEGRQLFSVNANVHNRIRLVVMTSPQDYAGNMLIALAGADEFKRRCFREYVRYLRDHGFRLQLQVDGTEIQETPVWPEKWRGFSFRMTKSPLPESDSSLVMTDVLEEGMKSAVTLMLTLLDVTDTGDGLPENLPGNEGEKASWFLRDMRGIRSTGPCASHERGMSAPSAGLTSAGFTGRSAGITSRFTM